MPYVKQYPLYKKVVNLDQEQVDLVHNEQDSVQTKNKNIQANEFESDYTIYVMNPIQLLWKPENREGQTLVTCGNKGYLYAGVGKQIL